MFPTLKLSAYELVAAYEALIACDALIAYDEVTGTFSENEAVKAYDADNAASE